VKWCADTFVQLICFGPVLLVVYLFEGSASFQGKWCKCQADPYQRLYQAAEIRSRSAATRWTWMTRRQASETLWLM
jgi:hypothetical protein